MNKKNFIFLPTFLISLLSGCSGSEKSSVSINVYVQNDSVGKSLVTVAEEFNKNNKYNIDIVYETYGEIGDPLKSDYDLAFIDGEIAKQYYLDGKVDSFDLDINSPLAKLFKVENYVTCFPLGMRLGTSLYYDSSTYTKVDNWNDILTNDNKAAICSFSAVEYFGAFYANGLDTTYQFGRVSDNLNSEKGLKVAKGLSKLFANESLSSIYKVDKESDYKAVLSTTYQEDEMKSYFGENYKTSSLPSFSLDNDSFKWADSFNSLTAIVSIKCDRKVKAAITDFVKYLLESEYLDTFLNKFNNQYISINKLDAQMISRVEKGKDYANYPMDWYQKVEALIRAIKNDRGELNETALLAALEQYHQSL